MKKRAEFLGVKVEFLMIDEKDIDKLTKEKDRYVAFAPEKGKIKLAFLPHNKDYVLHCLYADKYQAQGDDLFSVTRNSKVNTRLKSEAALGGKQIYNFIIEKLRLLCYNLLCTIVWCRFQIWLLIYLEKCFTSLIQLVK